MSLLGVKQTCRIAVQMSAYGPKRTSRLLASVSPKFCPPFVLNEVGTGGKCTSRVKSYHQATPTFVRDYARGNLDEAELWEELTTLGYSPSKIEWHIANPGRCLGSKGLKWMKN